MGGDVRGSRTNKGVLDHAVKSTAQPRNIQSLPKSHAGIILVPGFEDSETASGMAGEPGQGID